jgi:hypothetical protein
MSARKGRLALGALLAAAAMLGLPAPGRAAPTQANAPATLTIHTVPALEGVKARLDGRTFVSGVDGDIHVPLRTRANLTSRLRVLDSRIGERRRATFARWWGDLSTAGVSEITAKLNVSYEVRFSFKDLEGDSVSFARVTSLKLKSSHGVVHHLTRNQLAKPLWLHGTRVVTRQTGLERKDIYYTVDSAIVDGANVVNRGQQRFFPSSERSMSVELLFFTAWISARDALFRFPIGSAVRLKHPDGHWERYPLEAGGELVLSDLPRGDYWVEVDAPGMSFIRPVSLSRNQVVRLEVLSYFDIGITLFLVALVTLGLLFIGRPHLLGYLDVRRLTGHGRPARGTGR